MTFSDVPVPEVYKESADFRFFMKWFELCLSNIQFETDNFIDLIDPLRCPTNLLWLLADTCGYKYDERASIAFNRLVLLYFAKLIRNRGSRSGMILAAQINLDQFNLDNYAKEDPILEERLDDTTIPVNSVSVTKHTEHGYIDVVYYSERVPTDICMEYVRPIGMYCFTHSGVSVNARTKVSVDARLTNLNDTNLHPGPAFIAHYRREDYARLQKYLDPESMELAPRKPVFYRNADFEKVPKEFFIDPGYRSLFSLQISNNEHIVKALLPSLETPDPIFSLGYGPQDIDVVYPDNYLKNGDDPMYNLRIDKDLEESYTPQVYTVETAESVVSPKPAVNPVMFALGDAMSLNDRNTAYTKYDKETGKIKAVVLDDDTPGHDDDEYSVIENGVINKAKSVKHVHYISSTPEVSSLVVSPKEHSDSNEP